MAEEQDTERGLIGIKNDEEEEKEPSEERKEKPGTRTKGNQRWMKLRTTVQLSGAISHTIQKSKPPLKREDSFLKRFSTRQIPELEETVDTGEEAGYSGESSSSGIARLYYKKQRRKRKQPSSVYTVVNPDGNLYFYWLLVVSVGVLYNLWTLIVRQAFPELQDDHQRFWSWADIFTDLVFLLDVGVQLRTGYLEQGLMVYDSKKLAGHYVKSRKFLLDLLALFPLELAQFNLGVKPMLRFPRFLKIYRVYTYYYIVESRTVYPNVWRVVNLIHILLILAHWFGCFYFLLSEAEGFQGDWVYPYRPGEYATLARKYLGSLYWSTLTLTTIGDLPTPETNADKGKPGRTQLMRGHKSRLLKFSSNLGYIFTIVSYLIGVFIFATIVGQVGNVITNRNANRLEFERLLDGAKTYMRHHKVPGGMKRRVLRWYDYSWSRGRIQGGGDINTALGLLPDKLKTELALHVNLSVLKKVTIFQECQPEFLHDLVLKMKAYIFTPGDMICRKGEVAREMFIIADGILEVMSETGRVLTTMKAGDFFGEIGILNLDGLNKRTADVRSVGYSELFSLSREDVLTAMKDYPEAQEILQTLGRKRLMEARNLNRAWKMSEQSSLDSQARSVPDTSAQQKKEGKLAAQNPPKPDKSEAEENNGNKGSIVDKLKGDVKELRNVFKKSSKTIRGKSECVEIEMSKCHIEREKENNLGGRAPLARAACAYDGDTSHDEDSQPAPKPLGAGLPLMQRLKLLKEKEEQQRKASEEAAAAAAPPSAERKELDPALPLLQRILQMKQKDEKKSEVVVQNTANMAAEVLATTVRTQLKSPTTLTLKPNLKSENAVQNSFQETKAPSDIHKKLVFKEEQKMSIDLSGPTTKEVAKKEMDKRNTSECDNESWILIKKAILIPNNSLDISEKKSSDIKKSEEAPMQQLNYLKEKTLSVINSVTDTSGENSLNQQLEKTRNDKSDNLQRLFLRSTDDKIRKHKDNLAVHSDDESCHRTFPIQPSPRIYKRRKIYHSIDDLSPEYSGLPFVKKLKILNERQKLAELEKSEKDEKILEPCCSHKMTDPLASQVHKTSDESRPKKPSENNNELSLIISEGTLNEDECSPSNNMNEEGISPSKINESLQAVLKDTEVPLLSPESNETLERRQLKSILKKLTSVSTNNSVTGGVADGTLRERKSTAEIRKLLRAPTVEGYAARHSKFTKSMTLHHNTVEDVSSRADSLTDSISNFDENDHNAHSWDNSAGRTKFSTWTDSSRSLDDSQLTEISTFENSAPPPFQSEKYVESTVTELHQSVDEIQKWEYFSSEYEDNQIKLKDTEDRIVPDDPRSIGVNCFPKELLSHLFFEIRKVIDDHMDRIENNYVQKYAKLEHEYKKKEETVLELQKKIQELENKGVSEPEIPEEDEEEESMEEKDEEDSDTEVSHCGIRIPLHPMPMPDLSSVRGDSDDSSSSDEDANVFHNDWEIHLLAEEMEKQEASRERAVSFDFSQLERKQEAESSERRRARWSSASEPVTVRSMTHRSMSTNNIPRFPRRTHLSYNGTYTSITSTSQLKKPASFSNDFS